MIISVSNRLGTKIRRALAAALKNKRPVSLEMFDWEGKPIPSTFQQLSKEELLAVGCTKQELATIEQICKTRAKPLHEGV